MLYSTIGEEAFPPREGCSAAKMLLTLTAQSSKAISDRRTLVRIGTMRSPETGAIRIDFAPAMRIMGSSGAKGHEF